MPEKSASSQVRPNTPGGVGQAPIQSGQGGPVAPTPLQAVDQSHQGEQRPAAGFPDADSPGAKDGREQRVWKMGPSPERWRERSRTFEGIARAMAEQWSQTLWAEDWAV